MKSIIGRDLRSTFLTTSVLFTVVATTLWFNISPFSYHQYLGICHSNYGPGENFNRCMGPYWDQYNLDRPIIIISLIGLIISLLIFGVDEFRKKLA